MKTREMTIKVPFNNTPDVQLRILAHLARDDSATYMITSKMVRPSLFDSAIHNEVYQRLVQCVAVSKGKLPTKEELKDCCTIYAKRFSANQSKLDDWFACIDQIWEVEYTPEYLDSIIKKFIVTQNLTNLMFKLSSALEAADVDQYQVIVDDMLAECANLSTTDGDLGTDVTEEIEVIADKIIQGNDDVERFTTGIAMVDKLGKGGCGRGELALFMAAPGVGKTTTMINCGAANVSNGCNVGHISLENSEDAISRNYAQSFVGMSKTEIQSSPDKFRTVYQQFMQGGFNNRSAAELPPEKKPAGKVKVKQFPNNSINANDIRALLAKWKQQMGFVPDVLIVDYLELINPVHPRGELRLDINAACEDLRRIAVEYNIAVYSAVQGNRGAINKEKLTMADMSESFAPGKTADILICLGQTDEMKKAGEVEGDPKTKGKGKAVAFVDKFRDAPDKYAVDMDINYSTKRVRGFTEYNFKKDSDKVGTNERPFNPKKAQKEMGTDPLQDSGWGKLLNQPGAVIPSTGQVIK